MASYFLDSSAVVKRYHWEVGSGWVRAICNPRNHPRLYLSALARVEVVAGLRRTGRNEMLHPSYVDAVVNIFRRQLALSDHARQEPVYNLVPMSDAVLRLAANLCDRYAGRESYPLRSLDAIQLASALAEASNVRDEFILVTSDVRLAMIAEEEGLSVVNPSLPPQP